MSWKGFTKAVSRLPHQLSSMAGYSDQTVDEEFNELNKQFEEFHAMTKKLFDDAQKFKDSFSVMLDHQCSFAETLSKVFENGSDSVPAPKSKTPSHVEKARHFETAMRQARDTLKPDLEVIETRVIAPVVQLLQIQDNVKRHITKRHHKLLDYDRYKNSTKSMAAKTDRDAKDEKKLGQLETAFDIATREYNHINNTLKQEIPTLLGLKSTFMDPLFQTLYSYQRNVYSNCYQLFDKVVRQNFDAAIPASRVFLMKSDEMNSLLASLTIIKRPLNRTSNQSSPTHAGAPPNPSSAQASQANDAKSVGVAPHQTHLPSYDVATATTAISLMNNTKSNTAIKTSPTTVAPLTISKSFVEMHGAAAPPYASSISSPAPIESNQEYVIALYDFDGHNDDDLSFKRDDQIEILEKTNSTNDWWKGRLNGRIGMFPANYVSKI